MTNQKRRQAEPADIPDDAEIHGGANYEAGGLYVIDPDPVRHYFFAADDGDRARPDGAHRLMREKGYTKSDKRHSSPDCILLEEPIEAYEARERSRRVLDQRKLQSAATGGGEFEAVRVREDQRHGIGEGRPVTSTE